MIVRLSPIHVVIAIESLYFFLADNLKCQEEGRMRANRVFGGDQTKL